MLRKITYGCQISLSLCTDNEAYLTTDLLNDSLVIHKYIQNEILNFEKCVFMIIPVLNHLWVGKLVDLVHNDMDLLINKGNEYIYIESTFKSRQQTIRSYEHNLDEEMMANIQCF
jgi:inositol 1,4,5-triphosphate receptor type 3